MKATVFNGSSVADVYTATQTTAFQPEGSPSYSVTSYTPPIGTWKITNTLVAPNNFEFWVNETEDIWINESSEAWTSV